MSRSFSLTSNFASSMSVLNSSSGGRSVKLRTDKFGQLIQSHQGDSPQEMLTSSTRILGQRFLRIEMDNLRVTRRWSELRNGSLLKSYGSLFQKADRSRETVTNRWEDKAGNRLKRRRMSLELLSSLKLERSNTWWRTEFDKITLLQDLEIELEFAIPDGERQKRSWKESSWGKAKSGSLKLLCCWSLFWFMIKWTAWRICRRIKEV